MPMTLEEIKEHNLRNVIAVHEGAGQGMSKGLGDTVAKVAKLVGADKVAQLYTRLTGKNCGCEERRKALNRIFPYDKGE